MSLLASPFGLWHIPTETILKETSPDDRRKLVRLRADRLLLRKQLIRFGIDFYPIFRLEELQEQ
jgi:hypothetical protein